MSIYIYPQIASVFVLKISFLPLYSSELFTFLSRPMFKEFIAFLSQYNIIGIAIGLLVATKVGELVKGMIDNLITPMILNPILTRLKVKKMEDLSYKGILYGKVISTLIDFLITAFLVFLVVKYMDIKLAVK